MGQKLNTTELFHFCEQFSFILRSGMSAAEGLQILIDDCDVPARKKELESIASHFDICGSLYESLEESHIFPSSMTAYVKVGEETGCLDEIKQRLGYRLSLTDVYHSEHAVAGKRFNVNIGIRNNIIVKTLKCLVIQVLIL